MAQALGLLQALPGSTETVNVNTCGRDLSVVQASIPCGTNTRNGSDFSAPTIEDHEFELFQQQAGRAERVVEPIPVRGEGVRDEYVRFAAVQLVHCHRHRIAARTDAIRDEKVLKFKVDYHNVKPQFKGVETEVDEKKLSGEDAKKA